MSFSKSVKPQKLSLLTWVRRLLWLYIIVCRRSVGTATATSTGHGLHLGAVSDLSVADGCNFLIAVRARTLFLARALTTCTLATLALGCGTSALALAVGLC